MLCRGLLVVAFSASDPLLEGLEGLIPMFTAGRVVRSCRCIRAVAGAGWPFGKGVVRSASSAKYGSSPLWNAFLRVFLTVWVILSMKPLLCGYSGLLLLCTRSHSRAELMYSRDVYWGPLSEMTSLGIPNFEKIRLVCITTREREAREAKRPMKCGFLMCDAKFELRFEAKSSCVVKFLTL